jgi:hypothetical protein
MLISLTGGLGNQLFQLAAGISLSKNTPIGLEYQLLRPRLASNGKPDLASFKLPPCVILEDKRRQPSNVETNLTYMMIKADQTNKYIGGKVGKFVFRTISSIAASNFLHEPRWVPEVKGLGFSEISLPRQNILLTGFFQSYKWAFEENTFDKLHSMRVLERSELIPKYKEIAEVENPLIVHIRLGDYRNVKSFGIPASKYYNDSIREQLKNFDHKKIWVVTNDPKAARLMISDVYSKLIRWVPEIEESAAKTLEVMRFGSGYIIGNSSFSWWAAALSYSKNPIVISPDPWFQDISTPKDLIPPHWKRNSSYLDGFN